ncbi:hypothetical protein HMPREF3218_0200967 [Prevotella bivia]|nr:hypothetical protein HMPREF3218_0200967 [Prevotella bivia]
MVQKYLKKSIYRTTVYKKAIFHLSSRSACLPMKWNTKKL